MNRMAHATSPLHAKHKHVAAFTLVELSIVLVIIGLIVGGVLVGQDLIKAATVRSQITQLQQVETAIYTFRNKYGALPGDMPNATQMFGTTDANGYTVANGNGDGTIMATLTPYTTGCMSGAATQFRFGAVPNEVEEVFHHLNLANMGNYNIATPTQYAGSGLTSLPNAAMGGGMFVSCLNSSGLVGVPTAFTSGTAIAIGAVADGVYDSTRIQYALGWAVNYTLLTISPDMALRLDGKIDDGLPQTGNVGTFMTCTGNSVPATYQSLASTCNVSIVKMLWQTN